MPVQMQSVFSSNVDSIGYDVDTQELHVAWAGGKTSVYRGVPADVAEDASKSWSVGQFLNENVKDKYPHQYLGQE
jgi:KTSC domain